MMNQKQGFYLAKWGHWQQSNFYAYISINHITLYYIA